MVITCITALSTNVFAQQSNKLMQPSQWQYDTAKAEFTLHLGVPALQPKEGKSFIAVLKNTSFADGTIEFDVDLTGQGFPGINFRMSADGKNSDNFYIRSFADFNPLTRTTLQYAPVIDGISMWDITDEYQAGATLHPNGWNHVKLVIAGQQMKAYVNNMQRPALLVPQLESGLTTGSIALSGNVIFANLTLKPDVTEGLDPQPGFDPMYNDTRYLRHWQYTQFIPMPAGREPIIQVPSFITVKSELPDSTAQWKPIEAGPRAMVNLSRIFGAAANIGDRRFCWVKTIIYADSAQDRQLHFGFSDEVWVLINGQLLYVDKNCFGTPNQKDPKGRATTNNTTFTLPLKKGDNQLLVGLANYFYGWGIVARLDTNEGLHY